MLEKEPYIPRNLENRIDDYLKSPEIIAIIGPRQCGKTTLLHHIAAKLGFSKTGIIDFEDRDELNLFMHDIKAFAELHVQEQNFLFIDEFQYAADGGKNLKYSSNKNTLSLLRSLSLVVKTECLNPRRLLPSTSTHSKR